MGLAGCQNVRTANADNVILPNPALLGCSDAGGCRLWRDNTADPKAVYPKQLMFDIKGSSPSGVMAEYDKSVSIDKVRAEINEHYGRWGVRSGGVVLENLWRVEPERFAISLSTTDEGATRVVFLSFR